MGNEPLGTETSWVSGEPNNWAGIESCGWINPSGWNDMPCSMAFPFMCFDGKQHIFNVFSVCFSDIHCVPWFKIPCDHYNIWLSHQKREYIWLRMIIHTNHVVLLIPTGTQTGNNRYRYISTTLSWYKAQIYCRQHYTDLASARDATENSLILGLISGGSWFGLFRDTWKWVDKANFSTISWKAGRPNNAIANCGYLDNGQAVDAPCSNKMPFFCYSSQLQCYSAANLYTLTLI